MNCKYNSERDLPNTLKIAKLHTSNLALIALFIQLQENNGFDAQKCATHSVKASTAIYKKRACSVE